MTGPASGGRKNLLVFHLESVSWQTVNAFPEAFPHLTALIDEGRSYRRHYSAATSTLMVLAALLHGNDCEMDAAAGLTTPAGHAPSLFGTLTEEGYNTAFLCATSFPGRPILRSFGPSLPPARKTNDFGEFIAWFEGLTSAAPFAAYAWCQLPHIEANLALASHARDLDDLVAGGCAVSDNLLGALVDILRRSGKLEDTVIVVYGDHGDDYGAHGFRGGLQHAMEPYAALIHTPLVIRDASLPAGSDNRLASTTDIAATCLDLLGLPQPAAFAHGGHSLVSSHRRAIAFAQNLTANQPDWDALDVRKCFAAIDRSHVLQVSCQGLALYDHRLDPGNHHNLLHHFDPGPDGGLILRDAATPAHSHFNTIRHLWRTGTLQESFGRLRDALRDHVAAKNALVAAGGAAALNLLDLAAFDEFDREGRAAFFDRSTIDSAKPAARVVATPRVRLTVRSLLRRLFPGARSRLRRQARRLVPRPLRSGGKPA